MQDTGRQVDQWLGTIIDNKYRLVSLLGEGGMAIVFVAERLHLRDNVAIKILQPGNSTDPESCQRFQIEAAAAAQVKHPNVVTIYDFGYTVEGILYIVMELLEGLSLDQEMRQHDKLALWRVIDIMKPVCSAISAAHAIGLLHRDIKPGNIILHQNPFDRREVVKVLDFGIAKFFDSTEMLLQTSDGIVLGTAEYMSPEQCQGLPLDGRCDIYSLALVCYQMLSGQLPFRAPSTGEYLVSHVKEQPLPLRNFCPELPSGVEKAIMKALSKNPTERQRDALEFIEDLERASKKKPVKTNVTKVSLSGGMFFKREAGTITGASNVLPPGLAPAAHNASGGAVAEHSSEIQFSGFNNLAGLGLSDDATLDASRGSEAVDCSTPRFDCFVSPKEMVVLARAWEKTMSGEGQALVVLGDAGVGKSYLLEKFSQQLPKTTIIVQIKFAAAREQASEQVIAAAVYDWLTQWQATPEFTQAVKIWPEIKSELIDYGQVLGEFVADPELANNAIWSEAISPLLRQLIAKASSYFPMLLILDDLHQANETVLDFLTPNLDSWHKDRCLLLAAARVGHNSFWDDWFQANIRRWQPVYLGCLGKKQTFELIRKIFYSVALTESQVNLIYRESGGNPFFIVEILRFLIASGQLNFEGKRWRSNPQIKIGKPAAIAHLVESILAQFSPVAREVLQMAAIIGEHFELSLLRALTIQNEDVLEEVLQLALSLGVARPLSASALKGAASFGPITDTRLENWEFTNGLVRRVLAESSNRRARRKISRDIAEWLRQHRPKAVAELARHYFEAGEWQLTFFYCVQAAKLKMMSLEINNIRHYLTQAEKAFANLESWQELEKQVLAGEKKQWDADKGDLLANYRWLMGLVFVYLSKATPAKQMLQQATVLATLGNDRNLLARLNLTEGQLYTALGNKSVAWAKFKTASQYYAELNNRRGQSRALVAISRICAYDGDYVRAYDYALAAQEIALLANETNLECIALANAAVMLSNIRSFPEAMATAKKAAAIARSSGQELACCYTYNAIAQIYFDQGLYGKAVSPRREALRFARNISNRYLEITTLVALAQSYFYAAEYQEAERNFAKALSLVETGNCHYLEFIVLIGNARLAGRLEHRTLAQGYMKRAEGLLTKIDFHEGICDFYTAAAEILLQEQNFLEALLAAEKAITAAQKIASIMHEWMPRFIQAQALFQTGETAKALSAIDKAAKYLEQLSMAIADEDLRQQYLEQIDRKEVFSLHEELTAANVANSWAAEENAEEEVWDDE